MYPSGNNYSQNYPNQQQGYNMQQQGYGNFQGISAVQTPPSIGFNVDINPAPVYNPGYGHAQPAPYGGYDQQSQSYLPSSQGYPGPQPPYAPQGQYMPAQHNPQYGQPQTPQYQPGPPQTPQYQPSQPQTPQYQPSQPQTPQYQPSQPQTPQYQPSQPQTPQYQPSQPQTTQYQSGPPQTSQYQHTQYPTQTNQGYGNVSPYSYDQGLHQIPSYSQPKSSVNQNYSTTYPHINQTQQPPHNPSFVSNVPTTNYDTRNYPQLNVDCIGSAGETYRGTIKPYPNFNAEQDCNVLRKAMKGLGTDEKAIIECLGRRNLSQRLEIKKTFKTMFGKDLIEELKSELSGNFSRAVIESLYDSDHYDAFSLQKAMQGLGTREEVLTEILTSRSNRQIENIKDIYKKLFNKNLEQEIISETSGFYKRVLVSCLQANKKELTGDEVVRLKQQGPGAVVNTSMARQEAQELYNAGEKKIGTDEACFIKIFATRNKYQLKATFDEYQRIAGRDILSSIEREMSGDLASSLKAIAMQAINPATFFATRLYYAIKGAGTNDTTLIRILLTRSEIDLENVKTEFQRQYKKTLDSFVRGDTSGDYMKFLLRFVEGN